MKTNFVLSLLRWKGELTQLPYTKGMLLLFILGFFYRYLSYFVYLSFTSDAPLTLAAIQQAQEQQLLPMFTLLPLAVLFSLLDAKRFRNLGLPPALAFGINALTLLPKMEASSLWRIIAMALFAYRIALCILPGRSAFPCAIATNKDGKTVRIYSWRQKR